MNPINTPDIDDSLMARVAQNDTQALEELIARWQSRLYTFIYRMVNHPQTAEELAQETFWRLWKARKDYQPRRRFGAYLFQVASRECLKYWRAHKRRISEHADSFADIPAPEHENPDRRMQDAEIQRVLELALLRLPPKQRLALELTRLKGNSYADVAEILECSVGAVEQLVYRARETLRKDLDIFLKSGNIKKKEIVP